MTEITTQLSVQLSRVRLHSRRTLPGGPAGTPMPPTLVAVAHGSRDPRALETVTALLDRIRTLRPGLPVRLGHIELNEPLLPDTLAGLAGDAVLVPLLLSRGYHTKCDIPAMAAAAPQVSTRIAAPLGPHSLLAEALHERLTEAGTRPEEPGTGIVLAAAGSRDPDSATDTERTARLLSVRLDGVPVVPGYAAGAGATVEEAAATLRARGLRPVLASYFTAPGRFATASAAAVLGPAAAPLGDHPALARLVLHRYDQSLRSRTASDREGAGAATVAV
ncbi:sirohydrochlorin chelatase [Streptomyces sp. NPDC050315]|uniref:sirohydrochlorin chelatase n=1 Tax=Streptomyces sp. NPDC050315 TaxID=3155039 RepID=UPI0034153093